MICARDDVVLVLELKSSFLRHTHKEAWLHATTTLRKAGLQLHRKVEQVRRALTADSALATSLGIDAMSNSPVMQGWIVDTSIEWDHRRFHGFLKVSLEEVLIALRDDRHLLRNLSDLFGELTVTPAPNDHSNPALKTSLYADGFNARRFVEVIESEVIWN